MKEIRLGISPCPNDTFIFFHFLKRQTLPFGIKLAIRDVEELNRLVLGGELHVSKVSFALAGRVIDKYIILDSGAALGRGCGPLILARNKMSKRELARARIAIPGENTTAALLLRLFCPDATNLVEMPFNKIVDALCAKNVDAGCVIHETRFTYMNFGLVMLQDLGKWWEDTTGSPIPLGGIIAMRTLPIKTLVVIQDAIRKSIRFAKENFQEVSGFVCQHAQEISPEVQKKHIDLYVNDYSYDLGQEGREAIATLFERAGQTGLFDAGVRGLRPLFLSQCL